MFCYLQGTFVLLGLFKSCVLALQEKKEKLA